MVEVELTVLALERPSVWEADNVHWHVQVVEPVEQFLLVEHVLLVGCAVVPVDGEHGWQHHCCFVLVDMVDDLLVVDLVVWTDFVQAEIVFFLLRWLDRP